jgi:hypothetical protein
LGAKRDGRKYSTIKFDRKPKLGGILPKIPLEVMRLGITKVRIIQSRIVREIQTNQG